MPEPVVINGKKFITSKEAASLTGYARDYVGQLVRMGKVEGKVVEEVLFVNEESLLAHVALKNSNTKVVENFLKGEVATKAASAAVAKKPTASLVYNGSDQTNFLPKISKKVVNDSLPAIVTKKIVSKYADARPMMKVASRVAPYADALGKVGSFAIKHAIGFTILFAVLTTSYASIQAPDIFVSRVTEALSKMSRDNTVTESADSHLASALTPFNKFAQNLNSTVNNFFGLGGTPTTIVELPSKVKVATTTVIREVVRDIGTTTVVQYVNTNSGNTDSVLAVDFNNYKIYQQNQLEAIFNTIKKGRRTTTTVTTTSSEASGTTTLKNLTVENTSTSTIPNLNVTSYLTLNGDTIVDFVGSGLELNDGVLSATAGAGFSTTSANYHFDNRLAATTTLNNLTTLRGLTDLIATNATVTTITVGSDYITDITGSGLSVVNGALTVSSATGFSTTSADYWESTKTRWATTSDSYAFDTRLAATTTLNNLNILNGLASIGSTTGTTTIKGVTVANGNTLLQGEVRISDQSSPTTGAVYFGNTNDNRLTFDGSNYMFNGTGALFTSSSGIISQQNNSSLGIGARYNAALGTVYFGASNSATPDALISNSSGNEILRVTNDGNLGLGTSSPYAKLSVVGQAVAEYFTATSTTATSTLPLLSVNAISINGVYTNTLWATTSDSYAFDTRLAATTTLNNLTKIGTQSSFNFGNATGSSLFLTSLDCSLYSNGGKITTDSSGMLVCANDSTGSGGGGGGTDVNWTFINNSGITVSTTTNQVVIGASATSSLQKLQVSGGIYVTGNIGIGTTSPYENLSVAGNAVITGITRSSNFIATSTTATSTLPLLSVNALSVNGVYTNTLWATTSDSYAFDTRLAATTTLNNITTLGGLSLPITQTTGTLSVARGGTGQTSFGQGWLASDGSTLTSSTSPTVNYITATSTTATSTFAGSVYVGSRLGIGVTNPTAQFEISDTAKIGNEINISSLGGATDVGLYFNGDENSGLYSPGADTIALSTNGAERWRVDSAGNFGLGTSSPYAKLSVVGQTVSEYFTATSTTATSTLPLLYSNRLTIQGNENADDNVIVLDGGDDYSRTISFNEFGAQSGYLRFDHNAEVFSLWNSRPGSVQFGTNNLERATIDYTGNFGIGTTSPYAKLSVVGQTVSEYFTATSTTATSTLPIIKSTYLNLGNNTISNLTGTGLTNVSGALTVDTASIVGTGVAGQVPYFASAGSALTATSSLFIATSSWVGVGTTTPQAGLHIVVQSRPSYREDFLKFSTTDVGNDAGYLSNGSVLNGNFITTLAGYTESSASQPSLNLRGITSAANDVSDSSNFGIIDLLSVITSDPGNPNNGTLSSVTNRKLLTIRGGISSVSDIKFTISANGNTGIASSTPWGLLAVEPSGITGPAFVIGSSTGTNFIVTNGGNVGIGTTTPTQRFSVNGNVWITGNATSSTFTATSTTATSTLPLLSVNALSLNGTYLTSVVGGNGQQNRLAIWSDSNTLTSENSVAWDDENNKLVLPTINATNSASILELASTTILRANNTQGSFFAGQDAGNSTGSGFYNTAFGQNALQDVDTGTANTAVGRGALAVITSGSYNIGVGYNALPTLESGSSNVVLGSSALSNFTSGDENIVIGPSTGATLTSGSYNILLGSNADAANGISNAIAIGYNARVDASNSLVLGRNVNVGIGTTSPYAKLSVVGQAVAEYFTATSTTATSTLPLVYSNRVTIQGNENADDNVIVIDGGDDYSRTISFNEGGVQNGYLRFDHNQDVFSLWNSRAAGVVTFGTNNTEQVRIDSNGNFGIGTTSPYAKLAVNGETVALKFTATSTTATSTLPILKSTYLNLGSNTISNLTGTGLTNISGALTVDTASIVGTGVAGQVPYFASAGSSLTATSSLFIATSSWVGIGTTTPQAGLHIVVQSKPSYREEFLKFNTTDVGNDAGYLSNGSVVNGNFITTLSGYTDSSAAQGSVQIKGMTSTANDASDSSNAGLIDLLSVITSDSGNPNNGTLSSVTNRKLLTIRGGTNFTTDLKFAISANGNTGIASSTPWGLLAVNPSGITGPAFVVGSSTGTNFIVTNGGNVGIGTSSPYTKFAVVGEAAAEYFTATSTTATSTFFGNTSVSGNFAVGSTSPWGKAVITNAGAGPSLVVEDSTSDTSPFIIDTNGNVGVGTTSPTGKLEIAGGSQGDSVRFITSGGAGNRTLSIDRTLVTNAWSIQSNLSNTTATANIMLNPSGGSIGIGTTTTSLPATLAVQGSGYINSTLYTGGDLTVNGRISATSTTLQYVSNTKVSTLYTYGDSITQGALASSSTQYYPTLMSNLMGYTLVNQGVNGSVLEEAGQIDNIYAQPVSTSTIATFLTGYNNHRYYGTTASKLDTYKQALPAALAYLAIPDKDKVFGPNWSTTGTWAATSTYATTTGIFTRTAGSTATATLYGNTIYVVGTRGGTTDTGTITINVDGTDRGTYNCYGVDASFTSGRKYAPFMMRISNLNNGQHVVKITSNNTGYCEINWGAGNTNTASDGVPAVYVGGALRMTDDQYANNSPAGTMESNRLYNQVIEGVVKTLASDGLNVIQAETEQMFDPATMMSYDSVHPNALGHFTIAQAFLKKMSGTQFGNDKNFARFFSGYIPKLTIGAGTSTIFTIDGETGRFGVGTSSPIQALSVNGNAWITGNATSSTFVATSTTATSTLPLLSVSALSLNGVYLNNLSIMSSLASIGSTTGTTTFEGNGLITGNFAVGSTSPWGKAVITNPGAGPSFIVEDSTSDTSPFIIDTSGNVGIGTTSPSGKFEIAGGSQGDSVRFITAGGASNRTLSFDRTLASSGWSLQSYITNTSGVTSIFNINPLGGNVGIGTTSPYARLSVNGEAVALRFTATSTTVASVFPLFTSTSGTTTNATSTNFFATTASTTDIFAGGNISIGTSTGNSRLEIFHNGSNPALSIDAGISGNDMFRIYRGGGNGGLGGGLTLTAPNNSPQFQLRTGMSSQSGGTTRNVLAYDNPLGSFVISTSSISNGAIGLEPIIIRNTTANIGLAGSSTPWGSVSINGVYQSAGEPTFVVGSSTKTDFIIDQLGEVGIGTSSPWRNFSVVGTVAMNGLTTAAGTPSSICMNATTKEITVNAATTCVVSDRDQKRDIQDLSVSGLDAIRAIKTVTFAYNDQPNRSRIGFIAQDLQEVDNRLGDAFDKQGIARSIDIPAIMSVTVKAVQELDTKVDTNSLFVQTFASSTEKALEEQKNKPLTLTFGNGFRFEINPSTTTDKYLQINSSTGDGVITFNEAGNVGIGTSSSAYKLQVAGDIAATAFVNVSTRSSKKDIEYVNDDEKMDALEKLSTIKIARYHYKSEDSDNPLRLGLIAEEAPVEILSANGKGVDIYKLSTFTLSAVQAQQKKISDLEIRLDALEARVGSTTSALSSDMLSSLMDGMKNIFTDSLTVGSATKPSGITLFDEKTGEPYCIKVVNGEMKSTAGKCTATKIEKPTEIVESPKEETATSTAATTTPDVIETPKEDVASSTPTVSTPVEPEPVVETPKAEEPAPAVEAPKTEAPKEEVKAEAPKEDTPKTEAPKEESKPAEPAPSAPAASDSASVDTN